MALSKIWVRLHGSESFILSSHTTNGDSRRLTPMNLIATIDLYNENKSDNRYFIKTKRSDECVPF